MTRIMLAIAASLASAPAEAAALKIGRRAPDVELTPVDGAGVQLADLQGQMVVLDLRATWCVPCRKELPLLDAYHR